MTIPAQSDIGLPIIKLLADGQVLHYDELEEKLAQIFQLTSEEKNTTKRSGNEHILHNRIRWSVFYLEKAGLVSRPRSAHVEISAHGRKILKTSPSKLNYGFLKTLPRFMEWVNSK